jgi:hypothetical protein
MNSMEKEAFNFDKHTQRMFVGSQLLNSPLEAMYMMLAFIFSKELHATPLQLTLLISARPAIAILSFYGNLIIKGKPKRLKSFIAGTTFLGCLPSFFFPFVDNTWFFLFAFALFMMCARAIPPAWSEIFKINLLPEARGKIFSQGSSAHYLIIIFIPLFVSPLIDHHPHVWKWIFFVLAIIHSLTVFFTLFVRLKSYTNSIDMSPSYNFTSATSIILDPWKNCWNLMKQMPDFRKFQFVFMLGGSGLILMQPVLPIFFEKTLHLSYTQLTLAVSLCKSLSFALTSHFLWSRWINQFSIHFFNSCVTFCACISTIFIALSIYQPPFIYLAYLIYGAMQGGSEMSWHLSGPIFSKEKDSTLFTSVNVLTVGLRGCIIPSLGTLLFLNSNAFIVFLSGGFLCLLASSYSLWLDFKTKTVQKHLANI